MVFASGSAYKGKATGEQESGGGHVCDVIADGVGGEESSRLRGTRAAGHPSPHSPGTTICWVLVAVF